MVGNRKAEFVLKRSDFADVPSERKYIFREKYLIFDILEVDL
jgi:hypothetical protein